MVGLTGAGLTGDEQPDRPAPGRVRQLPLFYCPYCGEEDLQPREHDGEWFCGACLRSFTLRLTGTGGRP